MKLRNSKIKELSQTTGITIPKKSVVEETKTTITVDGTPLLLKIKGKLIPTINTAKLHDLWPSVYIDEGAVKHVINGASLMRPGITKFDTFEKDAVVIIKFEGSNTVLAVGIAEFSSEEIKEMSKGKVILTLHFLNDGLI